MQVKIIIWKLFRIIRVNSSINYELRYGFIQNISCRPFHDPSNSGRNRMGAYS